MKIWVHLLCLLSVAVCAAGDNPQVTLQITGAVTGTIVVEVYADKAPVTAENFVNYVQSGFYDGLIFHRVIPNFMIQGGGFDGSIDGEGNLIEKSNGSEIINESSNRLSNVRGTIAMARTYIADSARSQFFINVVDNTGFTGLDFGRYTYDYFTAQPVAHIGYCVFGRVLSGMDVVDSIAAVTTTTVSNMSNVPVQDVIIQSATVTHQAPVCAVKPAGDINGDCKVDLEDLSMLTQNWMNCNSITSTCN